MARIQNIRNREAITDTRMLSIIQQCIQGVTNLGYTVPRNLKFKKCKADHRAGLACYSDCTIVLSDFLWLESDKSIQGIIYHELAHILTGRGVHHGRPWQIIVSKINNAYGMHIGRLWGAQDLPVHYAKLHDHNRTQYKHKFRCKTCGSILCYQKDTKFTKTYDQMIGDQPRWTCRCCGGTFEKIK